MQNILLNTDGIFNYYELFNFSLSKNFHKPHSFNKADLCISVISANRTYYLIDDLSLLFYYIQKYEPNLSYDLVLIDTGTKDCWKLYPSLTERFHFDKVLSLPTFSEERELEGIPRVYEHSVHLCEKNSFIMFFEDDFQLISTPKIGFIQNSIDILNKSPHNLMGLMLRSDLKRQGRHRMLNIKTNNESFDIELQLSRVYQFNNGASIYRMSNIKELVNNGLKKNKNSMYELEMSNSARDLGFYFGFVNFNTNCTISPNNYCYGIFNHIGKKSSRIDEEYS